MALELGAEDPAAANAENAAEIMPEPLGLEPTVPEDAADASSLEIAPMMLDDSPPMDATPEGVDDEAPAVIEPIGLETGGEEALPAIESSDLRMPEAGASLLFADTPGESEPTDAHEGHGPLIEPLEIETADADAISLPVGVSDGDAAEAVYEGGIAEIEPIELDPVEAGAISVDADESGQHEPLSAGAEATAETAPLELETPADDVTSQLSEVQYDAEPAAVFGETAAEIEVFEVETEDADASPPAEYMSAETDSADEEAKEVTEAEIEHFEREPADLDAESVADDEVSDEQIGKDDSSQRASVPPTKEVAAVDLEALRVADEMVLRPTLDADVVGEEGVESPSEAAAEDTLRETDEVTGSLPDDVPRTTEVDVVELESLRQQDAFVAGSTQDAEVFEDGAEDVVEAEKEGQEEVEEGTGTAGLVDEELAETVAEVPLPLIMPEEAGGGETAEHAEPEPVVTETMAEVYAKQGLFAQAREIYEVLIMQHGDDPRLKVRLDELNEQASSALQESRQSRFSVAATGGESAVSYLQQLFAQGGWVTGGAPPPDASDDALDTPPEAGADLEPSPPEQAFSEEPPDASEAVLDTTPELEADLEPSSPPEQTFSEEAPAASDDALDAPPESDADPEQTPLEQAFSEDPPDALGEPTVPAADEVNLASVFDGGAPDAGSTAPSPGDPDDAIDMPGDEDGVTYDEFYGTDASASSPDAEGSHGDDESSDDDDNFKDWLEGLKT
jgi:hypothetical protein